MIDKLMSEICWAHKKKMNIAIDFKLLFCFQLVIKCYQLKHKVICNSKVRNLTIKFKIMAENEKKWKLETTDSVNTVSSAITPNSLTWIGCNATEELGKAVCVRRNYAHACWLLRDLWKYMVGWGAKLLMIWP